MIVKTEPVSEPFLQTDKQPCEGFKPLAAICSLAATTIAGVAALLFAITDTTSMTINAEVVNKITHVSIDPPTATLDTTISDFEFDRLKRNAILVIVGATFILTSTILLATYACSRRSSPKKYYPMT